MDFIHIVQEDEMKVATTLSVKRRPRRMMRAGLEYQCPVCGEVYGTSALADDCRRTCLGELDGEHRGRRS